VKDFRVYCYFTDIYGPGFMLYQAFSRIPGINAFWYEPKGTVRLHGKADLSVVIDPVEGFPYPSPVAVYDPLAAPAYEPMIWHPRDVEKKYDLGFIGDPGRTPERSRWVDEQLALCKGTILVDWESHFEDAAEALCSCRTALVYGENGRINAMHLEAMACEIPMITNADIHGHVENYANPRDTYVNRAFDILYDMTGVSRDRTGDVMDKILKTPPFEGTGWGVKRPHQFDHIPV
jgi:hypothetical protein